MGIKVNSTKRRSKGVLPKPLEKGNKMELKDTIELRVKMVEEDSNGNITGEKMVLVIAGEDENGEIQTITKDIK